MKGEFAATGSASAAIAGATNGRKSHKKVRGARHASKMIAANVTYDELTVIQGHAKRGGYESIAEYIRAVATTPQAVYDTDYARIAKPLADISYRLARALDALDGGDTEKVRTCIKEASVAAASALAPLARSHDRVVHAKDSA